MTNPLNITLMDRFIISGKVMPSGSFFSGKPSYRRTPTRRPEVSMTTYRAEKTEQVRLAYYYGIARGNWRVASKLLDLHQLIK